MSSQVLRGVHRFTKSTHVSAVHQIPLECGIYYTKDSLSSSPVFLYRLPPQAKASGLLEDAKAAYEFTRRWEITDESAPKRKVNVDGGSAGFFMAALTAHHLTPTLIALLSITGITTFRHHFFNSSVLLTPEPVTVAQAKDVAAKDCLAAWPATTIYKETMTQTSTLQSAVTCPSAWGEAKPSSFSPKVKHTGLKRQTFSKLTSKGRVL
ncbi:hypothetical protein C8034_v011868 [Colletotrichum sidae]|uniref:Alpha/beta hydrolase fold-3 domain-containing protein n=1 Tax=Colletotrichum sidae TaxID=1347389 RepID=A0A4R8TFH1_9PEZI|nr:hypothetical protein C8034_v011868 [Colletotrichum sidae]